MSKFFDFRFSIFIVMANIKNFLTTVFQYSTYNRMSFFFLLSLFDIHQDGECQKFFFFAFHFSIFEFEFRKAESENQTKLYCCCASFSISIISAQIFKLTA